MKLLTEDAVLVCAHELGIVGIVATQDLVTIDDRAILVDNDPQSRPIAGCPNTGAMIKPCTSTLKVKQGYSDYIQILGKAACLDTVIGLTDGTPPGIVEYKVRSAGQQWVEEN